MSPSLLKGLAALLVILAIGLAFAGWQLTRDVPRSAVAPTPEVVERPAPAEHPVLAAGRALPAGTRLSDAGEGATPALQVVDYPSRIDDSFADLAEVEGRVLTRPLAAGDILRPHHFALGGVLAEQVPPGKRAIAVGVDEVIGSGGYVAPGDRVDVFYYAQASDGDRTQLARRLLQDVEVLSFGAELQGASVAANGGNDSDEGPQRSGRTAVLALDGDQAPRLLLAETTGRLRLAVIGATERRRLLDGNEGLPSMKLLSASLHHADEDDDVRGPELGPAVLFHELTQREARPAAPVQAPTRPAAGRQVIQHVGGNTQTVTLGN
ncbi:Flp pilus assembly protein CpaB [Halomonas sp. 1513]|nr:Flp pilus assembly protein CpaB [Halomonas sp. 1513]APX92847.1 Flp pilus assembly protein CpaB [Halomonas sp. 1513]